MPIVVGVLAAIVISTPSAALTIGEPFSSSVSASGLTAGASYSYKIRIGTSSGSMTRGETKSPSGDWLSDNDSWTSFPTLTTDALGIWSGTVTGRPAASAFTGDSFLVLRLHSSSNYDSGSVSAQINAAPVQDTSPGVTTPTTTVVQASSAEITFSLPAQANLGEAFKVPVSFKNFEANKEYYLKLRGVRTKSGAAFLADNQAWVEFPVAAADGSGNWNGELLGLVAEDKDPGGYEIRVRARRKDTDAYYESDAKGIKLVKVLIPVIATKSAVLGTESAKPKKTASKAAVPVETVKVDSSTDDMPKALIALGLLFLVGSAVSYIINSKWRSTTGPT